MVDANERAAELYRKIETGRWLLSEHTGGATELEGVGVRLAFDEIYAKTDGLPLDPE